MPSGLVAPCPASLRCLGGGAECENGCRPGPPCERRVLGQLTSFLAGAVTATSVTMSMNQVNLFPWMLVLSLCFLTERGPPALFTFSPDFCSFFVLLLEYTFFHFP